MPIHEQPGTAPENSTLCVKSSGCPDLVFVSSILSLIGDDVVLA
jgi:hypothetical protein